jgi:hypothetical protein
MSPGVKTLAVGVAAMLVNNKPERIVRYKAQSLSNERLVGFSYHHLIPQHIE